MKEEQVILVNTHDEPIGSLEKLKAHQLGSLHRAFSIFIFNTHGEWLLQKRATTKYHSANLWTNACCGHPRPGEATGDAAVRRLREEMGFTTELNEIFSFTYHCKLEKDLVEHEYDHVFIGYYNDAPFVNKEEVGDWRFVSAETIKQELNNNADSYTYWFKKIISDVETHLLKNNK